MAKAIIKENSGGGLYQVETIYDRALVDSELENIPQKIKDSRAAYLIASEKADTFQNMYEITDRNLRALKAAFNYYNDLLTESYKSAGETPPEGSEETSGGTLFNPPDPNNPPGGQNTTSGGSVIGGDIQSPPESKLTDPDVYDWYADSTVVSQIDSSSGSYYLTEDAPNGEIYIDDNKLFEFVESEDTLAGEIFVNITDGTKQIKIKTSRRDDFPLIDEAYFQTDDKWSMDYYYSVTPSGTKTIDETTKKIKLK